MPARSPVGAPDARAGPRTDGQAAIADARRAEPGLAPLIVKEIFNIIAALKVTGVSILLVEQNARAALQAPTTATCSKPASSRSRARGVVAADRRAAATYLDKRLERTATDAISLCTGFRIGVMCGLVSRNARPDNMQRFYTRYPWGLK
jgi:hypothetical protein